MIMLLFLWVPPRWVLIPGLSRCQTLPPPNYLLYFSTVRTSNHCVSDGCAPQGSKFVCATSSHHPPFGIVPAAFSTILTLGLFGRPLAFFYQAGSQAGQSDLNSSRRSRWVDTPLGPVRQRPHPIPTARAYLVADFGVQLLLFHPSRWAKVRSVRQCVQTSAGGPNPVCVCVDSDGAAVPEDFPGDVLSYEALLSGYSSAAPPSFTLCPSGCGLPLPQPPHPSQEMVLASFLNPQKIPEEVILLWHMLSPSFCGIISPMLLALSPSVMLSSCEEQLQKMMLQETLKLAMEASL